jgi:hypothetical protein
MISNRVSRAGLRAPVTPSSPPMATKRPASGPPTGRGRRRRRLARAALPTIAWLAGATPVFVYQEFARGLGASFWDPRLWADASVTALLAAAAGWLLAIVVIGLVRRFVITRGA